VPATGDVCVLTAPDWRSVLWHYRFIPHDTRVFRSGNTLGLLVGFLDIPNDYNVKKRGIRRVSQPLK
jgi:hypothetical protein